MKNNGCAFCVRYNNGQIVFSKYSAFCCMMCIMYDLEKLIKLKL